MKTSWKCMWLNIACLPVVTAVPVPYNWCVIGVQLVLLGVQVYSLSKGD